MGAEPDMFLLRAQLCNGHSELCERKYGNTTFLGSHDSFAFSGNPFAREYILPNLRQLDAIDLLFLFSGQDARD